MGRRTVKPAAERRADILAAALRLFTDPGLERTTMQDLAGAAGVATGTLYLYFPSKEHVLLGLHEEFHQGMRDRFAEVADALAEDVKASGGVDAGAAVGALLEALVGYSLEHRSTCVVLARYIPRVEAAGEVDRVDDEIMGGVGFVVAEGVKRGLVATSDPEMTARLLYLGVREALTEALLAGDEGRVARVRAQAEELARKALAPGSPGGPST